MPDEKQEPKPMSRAAATLAGLAAAAAPPLSAPTPEEQRISELTADRDRITAMHGEKVKRMGELAADRDRWKARAEKAEAAGDGLALERVTKERDGLKMEVSKLTKRITESNKEKDAEIAQLKATLKVSMSDANEAASQTARFRTTMEQAIKARDRAFAERDAASEERVEAIKRVAGLEEQIKSLTAPRPGSPTAAPAKPQKKVEKAASGS